MPEPALNDNCSASGCAALVDIRCSNAHSGDFFHVVVDCLLPNLATIDRAAGYGAASRSTHCVVGAGYRPFVEVLFEAALAHKNLGVREHCDELTQPRPLTRSASATLATPGNKALLRRLLLASSLQPTAPVEPTVILIERDATRRFENADAVAAALAAARGLSPAAVRRFTGHETQAAAMSLFADAAVVAGFHGAGHVNVLFTTRRDSRVIEWSTHWRMTPGGGPLSHCVSGRTHAAKAPQRCLWRSNGRAIAPWKEADGLRWLTLWLPLDDHLAANNLSTAALNASAIRAHNSEFRDLDHYVKDLPVSPVRAPAHLDADPVASWLRGERGLEAAMAAFGSGESPPGFAWDGAAWVAPTPEEALSLAVVGE